MAIKHLGKLKRWIAPRDGKGDADAAAERLLANAEHELSRVRRDLEGVLPGPSGLETTKPRN